MTYDLRQSIRDLLDRTDETDPHAIAEQVAADIPPRALRGVVAGLLPDRVREEMRSQRGTAPVSVDQPNGRRDLGAMTRDPWRMREFVPGVGWKFRGDLTADDLDAQADAYDKRASENAAHAKRCRLLAEQMRREGVATLRSLSVGVAA